MRHDFYKILSNVSVRFHKIFMRNPWQNARDFLQKSERWLSQSLNLWIPLNLLKWYDAKRTGLNSCPPLQQEVLQWNNLSWCLKFWLSCQKHPTWIFSGSKFASRLFNTKYKRYFSSKKKKTYNEKTVRAALITDTVQTRPNQDLWRDAGSQVHSAKSAPQSWQTWQTDPRRVTVMTCLQWNVS